MQARPIAHNCRVRPDHNPPVVVLVDVAQAENDNGPEPGRDTAVAAVVVVGFVAAVVGSAAVAADVVCEAV